MVIDDGSLVEYDAPAALLADPDSEFSRMVDETGPEAAARLRAAAFAAGTTK